MLVHFADLFITQNDVLHPRVIIRLDDKVFLPKGHSSLEIVKVGGILLGDLQEEMLEVDMSHGKPAVFHIRNIAD